jgi:hypothetical protein
MSDERSRDLISALGDDLRPVTPIPRLRMALGAVLAAWVVVVLASWAWSGLRPGGLTAMYSNASIAFVVAALTAVGGAGLVASLAASVPGRERLAWGAFLVGLLSAAAAAGLGTFLVAAAPGHGPGAPAAAHVSCLVRACGVALLPALVVAGFAARAAPYRPLVIVLGAAAGAAALGAVAAQATCPFGDPVHLMLGHVLAPVAGALVLTLPLLIAMRRLPQRPR